MGWHSFNLLRVALMWMYVCCTCPDIYKKTALKPNMHPWEDHSHAPHCKTPNGGNMGLAGYA